MDVTVISAVIGVGCMMAFASRYIPSLPHAGTRSEIGVSSPLRSCQHSPTVVSLQTPQKGNFDGSDFLTLWAISFCHPLIYV